MLEINFFWTLLWVIYSNKGSAQAATTTTAASANVTLSCYDCSEAFKYTWDPFTECQYYPTQAPLRQCMDEEKYCMVERVTYKALTVSIARGCTDECFHGCIAFGFGLTRLTCTSCCITPGCNTGNLAPKIGVTNSGIVLTVIVYILLRES